MTMNRHAIRMLAMILHILLLFFVGCGGSTRGTGAPRPIVGKLLNEMEAPLENSAVTARVINNNGEIVEVVTTTTDSNGDYELLIESDAVESIEFSIDSNGFNDTFTVDEIPDDFSKLNIDIEVDLESREANPTEISSESDSEAASNNNSSNTPESPSVQNPEQPSAPPIANPQPPVIVPPSATIAPTVAVPPTSTPEPTATRRPRAILPTPTVTPTFTPTTAPPTPSETPTPLPTPTEVPPTATNTPTPIPTDTPIPIGDGTFSQTISFQTAADPADARTLDLNGDNLLDLAIFDSEIISFWRGVSGGNFVGAGLVGRISGNDGADSFDLGDFNGDGFIDIVTVDDDSASNVSRVRVSFNLGSAFFYGNNVESTESDRTKVVLSGDFDESFPGEEIIIGFSNPLAGTSIKGKVYRVLVDGTLDLINTITGDDIMLDTRIFQGVKADIDGDGRVDVAFSGTFGASFILFNEGDGTFTPLSLNNSGKVITPADLDDDGDSDIILLSDNGYRVLFNGNNRTFTGGTFVSLGTSLAAAAIADLNGDNSKDVLISDTDNNLIYVLLNNGSGEFTPNANQQLISSPGETMIAGDFTGDNVTDIAVATMNEPAAISILIGNQFSAPAQ